MRFESGLLVLMLMVVYTACAPAKTAEEPAQTSAPPPAEAPPQPAVAEASSEPTTQPTPDAGISDAAPDTQTAATPWTERDRAVAVDPAQPLPKRLAEALAEVEFDPFPEKLVLDAHYWVSNEDFHDLYKPHIDGLGGVYLGVGTDQNYLLAAWARSPILLMMDFDEQIRNVHDIYGSIFRRTETPAQHLGAWKDETKVAAWLAEDFEGERLAELQRTLSLSRKSVLVRLRKVVADYKEREVPTFMTDQEQYDFIRKLWLNGRVFSMRGDLTGDLTMVQIAKVMKDHQLTMGIIYLSNAEQYFDFTPTYRRNIIVQPFDEKSLILRTRPWDELGFPEGGKYHYNVQAGTNFAEWLRVHRVKNASRLLAGWRTNVEEVPGTSVVKRKPRPTEKRPEIAPHEE